MPAKNRPTKLTAAQNRAVSGVAEFVLGHLAGQSTTPTPLSQPLSSAARSSADGEDIPSTQLVNQPDSQATQPLPDRNHGGFLRMVARYNADHPGRDLNEVARFVKRTDFRTERIEADTEFVTVCVPCSRAQELGLPASVCRMGGVHADNRWQNLKMHFETCPAVKKYFEGRASQPTQTRDPLSQYAATMCLFSLSAHRFTEALEDMGQRGLLVHDAPGIKRLKAAAENYLDRSKEAIVEFFKTQKYFALAFDGGCSRVLGCHLLAPIIYAGGRAYALEVFVEKNGKGLDGARTATWLVATLRDYGIDPKNVAHIVSDAATVNFVAAKALSELRSLCLTAYGKDSIWDSKLRDEEISESILQASADLDDDAFGTDFHELSQLAEEGDDVYKSRAYRFVTDDIAHCPLNADNDRLGLPRSRHIVCIGHALKLAADRAMTSSGCVNSTAFKVVKNVSNMLYNAQTRKTRLTAVTASSDAALEVWKGQRLVALASVRDMVNRDSIQGLTGTYQSLLSDVPSCLSAVTAFLASTADKATTLMVLDAEKSRLNSEQYRGPQFAQMNDTRWENSVWRCFLWVCYHLERIAEFVRGEPRQSTCVSLAFLVGALDTPAKIASVKKELERWIDLLRPLASTLSHYSDVTKPQATRVTDDLTSLVTKYTRLEAAAVIGAKEVLKAITDELQKERVIASKGMWAFISLYCEPATLKGNILAQPRDNMGRLNTTAFRTEFRLQGLKLFQEYFWNKTIQMEADLLVKEAACAPALLGSDVGVWARMASEEGGKFRNIGAFFTYLVWLPPVVTGCDRMFSIETAIFAKNQGRMDPVRAGKLISCRLNGDVLLERSNIHHWFGQQRRQVENQTKRLRAPVNDNDNDDDNDNDNPNI